MNFFKNLLTKIFGEEDKNLTPEELRRTVELMAHTLYPNKGIDPNDSVFKYCFTTLLNNEKLTTANKYAIADVLPTNEELSEVLSVQMKLALAYASAVESLSYISAVQPLIGPVGEIFYLSPTDDGIKILSDAIKATARAITLVEGIEPTVTNTHSTRLSSIFSPPSTNNLNAIIEASEQFGLNIVRDIVQELITSVPLANNLPTAVTAITTGARRGKANFILGNNISIANLKTHYKFNNAGRSQHGTPYISEVGSITIGDATLAVFSVDDVNLNDRVVVGYKGNNGQTDAGFFVAPYVTSGTDLIDSKVYARIGTKFQYNGLSYYRTVPLKAKTKRTKKVEESPVVESP